MLKKKKGIFQIQKYKHSDLVGEIRLSAHTPEIRMEDKFHISLNTVYCFKENPLELHTELYMVIGL